MKILLVSLLLLGVFAVKLNTMYRMPYRNLETEVLKQFDQFEECKDAGKAEFDKKACRLFSWLCVNRGRKDYNYCITTYDQTLKA